MIFFKSWSYALHVIFSFNEVVVLLVAPFAESVSLHSPWKKDVFKTQFQCFYAHKKVTQGFQ